MVLAAVPGAAGRWCGEQSSEHREDLEHHYMERSGCSPQQALQCHPGTGSP